MPEHLIPAPALIGAWVAVGLTLFIFSFLYKDNPLFKLGEHLYVGISVGYSVVLAWFEVFVKQFWKPLGKAVAEAPAAHDSFLLIIPAFLGLLMLWRFIPNTSCLYVLPFAL